MQPIVRVSILRCAPERFAEFRQMLVEADPVLRPGAKPAQGFRVWATFRLAWQS